MSVPSHKIGKRIKNLREEKNLSREQLANLTNLSLSFITALEEEDLYPSLAPLQKVSRALGVRLGTFMDDQVSKDPIIIKSDYKEEDLSMQVAKNKKPSFHYHSLGKGKSDRNMEPFIIEIEADGDETLSSHEGEEFMYVIDGEINIDYGKEKYTLKTGDSIYYNSIVPHHVGTKTQAKILAVIYYPIK